MQSNKAIKTQWVSENEREWEEFRQEKGQKKTKQFRKTEDGDWHCIYIFEDCSLQESKKLEESSTSDKS